MSYNSIFVIFSRPDSEKHSRQRVAHDICSRPDKLSCRPRKAHNSSIAGEQYFENLKSSTVPSSVVHTNMKYALLALDDVLQI